MKPPNSPRWLTALTRVARQRGSLRLLSDEMLVELSEKHPDPVLRGELFVEMIHRAWLFGGGPKSLDALPKFRDVCARANLPFPNDWIADQRVTRSYTLPQEWSKIAPDAMRSSLGALLHQWERADGLIVFVRLDDDSAVRHAMALPFAIHVRHGTTEALVSAANHDSRGFEKLADGVMRANLVANASRWLLPGLSPGVRFRTLPGGCVPALAGPSAGFAVLLAHRLRHEGLHVPPLYAAASGTITEDGLLVKVDDPEVYCRKRELLESLGVKLILLPEPMLDGWPSGVPLEEKFVALVNACRQFAEPLGPIAIKRRIDDLAAGMRREGLDSRSARDELLLLIERHLSADDDHLDELRTEALLTLATAECHLGNAHASEAILEPLLAPDAPLVPHLVALVRQAVNLTDFGNYAGAVNHCNDALSLAATPRVLSRHLRNEIELQAHGTKGQALTFHGLWEPALAESGLSELRRAAEIADARDRAGLPADLPRNLAYIALWHALHQPSQIDDPWRAAWHVAEAHQSAQTRAHLYRYRWLAGYRGALLEIDGCWPDEHTPLPDAAIEGWPHRTARKYRGTALAGIGAHARAIEDFRAAAEMADWSLPILRFIGATAALQAGESLRIVAPDEAAGFLRRAILVFESCADWFSGPIAGRLWLARALALLEMREPSAHPQLHFPY